MKNSKEKIIVEQMMKNYLKRKVDQVFGADNNVCIQTINDRMALSGMGTIKFSDMDNFKDIITNIEFDGANMFFDWNKKTLATATMFTADNFTLVSNLNTK
ncbi:MAG: hypothetical protein MJZ66_04085 [Bacteroidales bacterium]|nr:hypothetical protein [Bacteroidales bacterium]